MTTSSDAQPAINPADRTCAPDWAAIAASLLTHLSPSEPAVHDDDHDDAAPTGEAVYHGWPRPDGQAAVIVEDRPGSYRPLPHRARHSPAGMTWGYNGNGPRDLARSLLTDALGACVHCPHCAGPTNGLNGTRPASTPAGAAGPVLTCTHQCDAGLLPLPYLRFTEQVIAALPQDQAWSLRRSYILTWLSRSHPTPPPPTEPGSPTPAEATSPPKSRSCRRRARPTPQRSAGRRS